MQMRPFQWIQRHSWWLPIAILAWAWGVHQLGSAQPSQSWWDATLFFAPSLALSGLVLFGVTRLKAGAVKPDSLLWIDRVLVQIRYPSMFLSIIVLVLAVDGLLAQWIGSSELNQVKVTRVMCSKMSGGKINTTTEAPILEGQLCFRPLASASFGNPSLEVPEQLITSPVELGQPANLTIRYFQTLFSGPRGYFEVVSVAP